MPTTASSPTPQRESRPTSALTSPTPTVGADAGPPKDTTTAHVTANTDVVAGPASPGDAPRVSGRLQKRKADAAARSTERKKKLGRAKTTAASAGGAAAPTQPTSRNAPGEQWAGSTPRPEHKAAPTASPSPAADAPPEPVHRGPTASLHLDLTDEATQDPFTLPRDTSRTPPASLSGPSNHGAAAGPVACPQRPVNTPLAAGGARFDLAAFLADGTHAAATQPGSSTTPCSGTVGDAPASSVTVATLSAQVLALQELVEALAHRLEFSNTSSGQQQHQHQQPCSTAPLSTTGQPLPFDVQRGSWTIPAGELPPAQLGELRSSSFPRRQRV